MTNPKALKSYWRMNYASDRRKHRHRCRHCNRIVQDGQPVFMARIGDGRKTKVLHVNKCADAIAVHDATELQLLECHGMQYLAGCGSKAAQDWLDASALTKTRPSIPQTPVYSPEPSNEQP